MLVKHNVAWLAAHMYAERVPIALTTRPSPTMAADFSRHYPNRLLVVNEAGDISLVHCPPGKAPRTEALHAYQDAVLDCMWGGQMDSLYALAVADMHVYVHDSHNQTMLHCLGQHSSNVRTVRFRPSHPSILGTASRDGCIALWDLRLCGSNSAKNRPTSTINDAHGPTGRRPSVSSVTMAEFMPLQDHLLASIGQPDYAIRFWDVRYTRGKSVPCAAIEAPRTGRRQRAFISLCVDSCGSSLYAVSADNNIYRYLVGNCSSEPLDVFAHPNFRTSGSFYIRSALSPDDEALVCGSTEGHAYIWPTSKKRRQVLRLAEHRYEVSCVAWSSRGGLFVGGEDYVSRIWHYSEHPLDSLRYVQPEVLDGGPPVSTGNTKRDLPPWRVALSKSHLQTVQYSMPIDPWPHRSIVSAPVHSPFCPPPIQPLPVSPAPLRIPMRNLTNTATESPVVLRKRQSTLDTFLTPTKLHSTG